MKMRHFFKEAECEDGGRLLALRTGSDGKVHVALPGDYPGETPVSQIPLSLDYYSRKILSVISFCSHRLSKESSGASVKFWWTRTQMSF